MFLRMIFFKKIKFKVTLKGYLHLNVFEWERGFGIAIEIMKSTKNLLLVIYVLPSMNMVYPFICLGFLLIPFSTAFIVFSLL